MNGFMKPFSLGNVKQSQEGNTGLEEKQKMKESHIGNEGDFFSHTWNLIIQGETKKEKIFAAKCL